MGNNASFSLLSANKVRIVLVGGCGFVGERLASALTANGYSVLIFDTAPLPKSLQADKSILYEKADVTLDIPLIAEGIKLYKPAAIVMIAGWGMSGEEMLSKKCWKVNFEGTQSLLELCRSLNVDRFIYTSTSNVVFHGQQIVNGDENMPYALESEHLDRYSHSKAAAEQLVLQSNKSKLSNSYPLYTSVIRPAAIYGEGETRHFSRIVDHIDKGSFLFRIGSAKVDWVSIENLVSAYMLLLERLVTDAGANVVGGKAYYISDGSPIENFEFLRPICLSRNQPFPNMVIPTSTVMAFAIFSELVYKIFWIPPLLTRAEVAKIGVTHYFSIELAEKDLNYSPKFDSKQGSEQLAAYFSTKPNHNFFRWASPIWWVLIPGAMYLFWEIAYDENSLFWDDYEIFLPFKTLAYTIFKDQTNMQHAFLIACACHAIEALITLWICNKRRLNSWFSWFLQTLILGYPSLMLLQSFDAVAFTPPEEPMPAPNPEIVPPLTPSTLKNISSPKVLTGVPAEEVDEDEPEVTLVQDPLKLN